MEPESIARRVLVQLSVTPEFREFALPELKAHLRRMELPLNEVFSLEIAPDKINVPSHQIVPECFARYPFMVLLIPDYHKHQQCTPFLAAKSSVMISKVVLLIGQGATYDQLIKQADQDVLQRYARNPTALVHCDFSTRNRTVSREEQVPKIHRVLGQLNVTGKVNANAPEVIFDLIEDHKWYEGHHKETTASTLQQIYFGVELSNFRDMKNHKFNLRFELPQRIYLGPTSTDNDLAFLMMHQCQISAGDFVLDPFVGTGSLLVPASYYHAHAFGADLDIRVLNGYAVGKINKRCKYYSKDKGFELFTPKIMLPFRQYGLAEPEIFRMDCLHSRFQYREFFDAIVCDPPYGIRAMSRSINKEATKKQQSQEEVVPKEQVIEEQQQEPSQTKPSEVSLPEQPNEQESETQVPPASSTQQTEQERKRWKKDMRRRNKEQRRANQTKEEVEQKMRLSNLLTAEKHEKWENARIEVTSRESIYSGLLAYAAEYLKPLRNLVFLYPIMEDEGFTGKPSELPSHPQFELLDYSVNKLAKGNIRVLVTMRKHCSPKQ